MHNLTISATSISSVDTRNSQQIDVCITGADLSFLSDISIKDIIGELDFSIGTDKILEELNVQDIIAYLEYRGYRVEEL